MPINASDSSDRYNSSTGSKLLKESVDFFFQWDKQDAIIMFPFVLRIFFSLPQFPGVTIRFYFYGNILNANFLFTFEQCIYWRWMYCTCTGWVDTLHPGDVFFTLYLLFIAVIWAGNRQISIENGEKSLPLCIAYCNSFFYKYATCRRAREWICHLTFSMSNIHAYGICIRSSNKIRVIRSVCKWIPVLPFHSHQWPFNVCRVMCWKCREYNLK